MGKIMQIVLSGAQLLINGSIRLTMTQHFQVGLNSNTELNTGPYAVTDKPVPDKELT